MARNNIFPYTLTQAVAVPSGAVSGEAVQVGVASGFINGVLLTSRANSAAYADPYNSPLAPLTNPGAFGGGNVDGQATVALDGVWEFAVTTGAQPGEGVPVYITAARLLTTTSAGNTLWGRVERGRDQKLGTDNGGGTWKCAVRPIN